MLRVDLDSGQYYEVDLDDAEHTWKLIQHIRESAFDDTCYSGMLLPRVGGGSVYIMGLHRIAAIVAPALVIDELDRDPWVAE